jgi:hypothetical protein
MEEYRFNFQSNYVQQLKYAYWNSLLVKFLNIFYPLYVIFLWRCVACMVVPCCLPWMQLNLSLLTIMPLMHVLENSIDAEMKSLMYLTWTPTCHCMSPISISLGNTLWTGLY